MEPRRASGVEQPHPRRAIEGKRCGGPNAAGTSLPSERRRQARRCRRGQTLGFPDRQSSATLPRCCPATAFMPCACITTGKTLVPGAANIGTNLDVRREGAKARSKFISSGFQGRSLQHDFGRRFCGSVAWHPSIRRRRRAETATGERCGADAENSCLAATHHGQAAAGRAVIPLATALRVASPLNGLPIPFGRTMQV